MHCATWPPMPAQMPAQRPSCRSGPATVMPPGVHHPLPPLLCSQKDTLMMQSKPLNTRVFLVVHCLPVSNLQAHPRHPHRTKVSVQDGAESQKPFLSMPEISLALTKWCVHLCSWETQFNVLLKRSLLAQLRNPTDTTSRLLLSVWVGMLAGALHSPHDPRMIWCSSSCKHGHGAKSAFHSVIVRFH